MKDNKLLIVTGTRPEIIKMAPVYYQLKNKVDIHWCHTGQHTDLAEQAFSFFSIQPDIVLTRTESTNVSELLSGLIVKISSVLNQQTYRCLLVHGDTSSTLAGAMAGFFNQVPLIAHIEAGLRSGDFLSPFPEEANRVAVARFANMHYASSELAKENLVNEGIGQDKIWVTGNTVVDSQQLLISKGLINITLNNRVLITAHRRENWENIQTICQSILEISHMRSDLEFLFSVHPNPYLKETVSAFFMNHSKVKVVDSLNYLELQCVLASCALVITDSGGIQEEAPTYGVKTLVLRESTERMDAVNCGMSMLVGANNVNRILDGALTLLDSGRGDCHNPFGDGHASKRIAVSIQEQLSL